MSYSIFYNKQFIKVDDQRVIPFMETGDNNVYEATSNRKRARDWHNSLMFGSMIVENTEIIAEVEKIKNSILESKEGEVAEADILKRFGWYSSNAIYGKSTSQTTFGMFKSFFQAGITQAKTIEELKEHYVTFFISVSRYSREQADKAGLEIKPDVNIETTQQLIDTIAEYTEYYKGSGVNFWLHTYSGQRIETMQRNARRLKQQARPAKKLVELDEYFALARTEGSGYFIENIKRGYRYAFTAEGGKKFATEKAAEAFHNKMKNKEHFTIERIAEKVKLLV